MLGGFRKRIKFSPCVGGLEILENNSPDVKTRLERLETLGYLETYDEHKLPYNPEHFMARKIDGFLSRYADDEMLKEIEEDRQKKNFLKDLEEELKHPGRYILEISEGGQLVELKRKLGKKPAELGKKKGDVGEGFSRSSRNSLIKFLLSIDYEKMGVPLFYTLTYPGEYSNDPRIWKRDLDVFYHRLKYKFGNITGNWRLEPQRRGAPHFCGFLWNCDWLKTMEGKKWFSLQWYEVVGSGDERHLRAGTGIDVEKDIEQRIFYIAKYQTKIEKGGVKQEFDYPVGRYWGAFNRKELAISKQEIEIDRELFFKVRRPLKKLLENKLETNRYREVIKGKQSGLWAKMDNETVLKLVDMTIRNMEVQE